MLDNQRPFNNLKGGWPSLTWIKYFDKIFAGIYELLGLIDEYIPFSTILFSGPPFGVIGLIVLPIISRRQEA
jgi:hypothetical protein